MASFQPDQLPETIYHTVVQMLVSAQETHLCRTENKEMWVEVVQDCFLSLVASG